MQFAAISPLEILTNPQRNAIVQLKTKPYGIDGKKVYTVTENIRITDANIIINARCKPDVGGWLGSFSGKKSRKRRI